MKRFEKFCICLFLILNNYKLFSAARSSQEVIELQHQQRLIIQERLREIEHLKKLYELQLAGFLKSPKSESEQKEKRSITGHFFLYPDSSTKKLWAILQKNIDSNSMITNNPIDIKSVQEAINEGAQVNYQIKIDNEYYHPINSELFPIEIAICSNNIELVKLFLENGATIENEIIRRVLERFNPLSLKTIIPIQDISKILEIILNKQNINVEFLNGHTPLTYAQSLDPSLTKLFLELGANANQPNKLKETPLMLAAKNKKIPNMIALLEAGANVNIQSTVNNETFSAIINQKGFEEVKSGFEDYVKNKEQVIKIIHEIPELILDLNKEIGQYVIVPKIQEQTSDQNHK